MSSAIVAVQTHRPSETLDNDSKAAVSTHGCDYYGNATHPGLVSLALQIVPRAREALRTETLFTYEAGPLLIGETDASYQLQKLVIEPLTKHDPDSIYSCSIDCLPLMDASIGRYVPHTTVYVSRSG